MLLFKLGCVNDSINKIQQSLEKRERGKENRVSPGTKIGFPPPHGYPLCCISTLQGPFIEFLLLISFGPWAFRKLTDFVKTQVDSATKTIAVHYQRLQVSEALNTNFIDPTSVGLLSPEGPLPQDALQLEKLIRLSLWSWLWSGQGWE